MSPDPDSATPSGPITPETVLARPRTGPTPPPASSSPPAATPDPPAGHSADLRLVAPALAVWSAAFLLLSAPPSLAYLTAALCALPGLLLLAAPFRPRHLGGKPLHRTSENDRLPVFSESRGTRREQRSGSGGRLPIHPSGEGGASRVLLRGGEGARRPSGFRVGRGLAGVVLVLGAASAVGTGLRVESVRGGVVREAAERGVNTIVEIVVKGEGRVSDKGVVIVEGRAVWVGLGDGMRVRTPVVVLARQEGWREVESGQRVRTRGRLAVPDRGELLGAVVLARGGPRVVEEAGTARRAATAVRDAMREAVRGLEPGARGVVPAMVLGDTAGIGAELKEEFKRSGLVHCLVVSGANFSILVLVVLWTARRAGLGNLLGAVLAGAVVLGFVLVVGTEPSVLRATVMGLIGLTAVCLGRERQGVPALAAAVVVLVLGDPGLARSYGFALSVLATSGLLVLAPRWRDRLSGAGMSRRTAEAIAIPLAAQAAVGPVLVLLSGTVSLVAVPANVLAAPAIAVATVCGFLTAAVAPFSPGLATLTVRPAGWAAGWVISVARAFAAVPYGSVPWRQGLLGALLLAALTAALVVAVRHRAPRRLIAAALAGLAVAALGLRLTAPTWPPRDWRLIACDVGQGDALVLHAAPGQAVIVDAGPDPALIDACLSRLSLHAVPLLFITHPHADHLAGLPGIPRDRTLSTLVHTSLSPATSELRALRTAGLRPVSHTPATRPPPSSTLQPGAPLTTSPSPFAVRYPPALFPASAPLSGVRTHGPFEHGRLAETDAEEQAAPAGLRVEEAAVGEGWGAGEKGAPAGLRVAGAAVGEGWRAGEQGAPVGSQVVSAEGGPWEAGEKGAPTVLRVVGTAAGERWRAGGLEIEVLAPRSRGEVPEGAAGTEVNNASLVLVARWPGLTVLLGGDLEEEGQRGLHGLVPRVDVLKVPHHGSARQEPAFLAEGRPRVALISVGRDNGYGHPSDRLLRMLRGVRVYRTDRHGDIAVTVSPRGLEVVTRS